jgi:hypothetical protein
LSSLARIDLAALRRESKLAIEVNDPSFVPHLDALFDGQTQWPVLSDGVNPLILELRFSRPVRLAAARLFPWASPTQWSVEARSGERWSVASAPPGAWSQLDLASTVETTTVRIEILRLERDDYVHLCEIELYAAPP